MGTTLQIDTAPPARAMGLGPLGDGTLIFKRKFRWTMKIEYCFDSGTPRTVAEEFVKIGSRPQVDIEETEINYLHGKMWIPGKATWQTMTVTYYDVAGKTAGGVSVSSIFGWIASVYDITDPTNLYMGSKLSDYEGNATIFLYDGCGNALEGWLLRNVWPQSVNFGELDMSSSEECTVELTLRYSNVHYKSYCPVGSIDKCPCTPCASL
jgi:hypothetical protein